MALDLLHLTGRRALVTGGGTGLGRQIATGLAAAGAAVTICGRRLESLREAAAVIAAAHPDAVAVVSIDADVTCEADLERLRAEAEPVDILVNNAGVALHQPWATTSVEDWRKTFAINLDAPYRLCQIFIPGMAARGWGRVINVASVYAVVGGDPQRYPGVPWDKPAYCVAKHGLHGLTHFLAARLAASGVCVNTLSPGGFAGAEQNRALMTPHVVSALVQQIPARRLGSETDLQAAAVFLASPGAAYVTGHNLIVDGGWTAI